MRLLGLTGNIACGKSTVGRMLETHGAVVIDADDLVRELYADAIVARGIAAMFGPSTLDASGGVDRAALGRLAFGDTEVLHRLEAFVHPLVRRLREEKLAALRASREPPPAAIIDAVKLVESGQAQGCDAVWCVVCKEEDQVRRLMEKRGLPRPEVLLRLTHQPSIEGKRELLQGIPLWFIRNEGSLETLQVTVDNAWAEFLRATPWHDAISIHGYQ